MSRPRSALSRIVATPNGAIAVGLIVLGCLSAVAITATGRGIPLMSSDSLTYVHWDPERTPLYPLVLWVVAAISPDYGILPWLQYAALVAAATIFSIATGEFLNSRPAGFVIGAAIFANIYLMRHASTMMPDCLYLALVLTHYVCVFRSLREPALVWPLLAGLLLGCAIIMRPVGYALLFATPFLLIAWNERRWLRALFLAATCAVPILTTCACDYLLRGYFATQAFGGINLALNTATLIPPQLEGIDPGVLGKIYAALEPLRRAESGAETWPMRGLVETLIYNSAQPVFQLANDIVDAAPGRSDITKSYGRQLAVNAVAWNVAIQVIEYRPIDYIAKVARQFYGMWFVPQMANQDMAAPVAALLNQAIGAESGSYIAHSVKFVTPWKWVIKMAVFGAMFAAAVAAVVWAPFRRDPALRGLAYLAASTMCYFGVTAGLEVAIPRYSLMAWPAQCAVLIGAVVLIGRQYRSRHA